MALYGLCTGLVLKPPQFRIGDFVVEQRQHSGADYYVVNLSHRTSGFYITTEVPQCNGVYYHKEHPVSKWWDGSPENNVGSSARAHVGLELHWKRYDFQCPPARSSQPQ